MLKTMLKLKYKKYSVSYQLQNIVFVGSQVYLSQWGKFHIKIYRNCDKLKAGKESYTIFLKSL